MPGCPRAPRSSANGRQGVRRLQRGRPRLGRDQAEGGNTPLRALPAWDDCEACYVDRRKRVEVTNEQLTPCFW